MAGAQCRPRCQRTQGQPPRVGLPPHCGALIPRGPRPRLQPVGGATAARGMALQPVAVWTATRGITPHAAAVGSRALWTHPAPRPRPRRRVRPRFATRLTNSLRAGRSRSAVHTGASRSPVTPSLLRREGWVDLSCLVRVRTVAHEDTSQGRRGRNIRSAGQGILTIVSVAPSALRTAALLVRKGCRCPALRVQGQTFAAMSGKRYGQGHAK